MENMENEVLSDDQLYAKIETEKLLKRKKTKRILTFSTLCVAMALAIVLIVLAAVPVSLKPRCIRQGFNDVTLFTGSSSRVVFGKEDEEYAKFLKYYNKAFSQSYLTALFSGSLNNYDISEPYGPVVTGDSFQAVKNQAESDRLLRLRFFEEKTLTTQNGKVYKSKWRVDSALTFTEAYFEANKTAGIQSTKIFIVANYPVFKEGELTGTEKRLVVVTVKADTNILYNAWYDLIA